MNSKECLESIKRDGVFIKEDYVKGYITDSKRTSENFSKFCDIINQDLGRLKKLEKENQVLREKVNHFKNVKNRYRRNEKFVEKENTKFKKAIEILKNRTVVIGALKLSKNLNDYNRMTTFKNLTQEEYELLKEVLEND